MKTWVAAVLFSLSTGLTAQTFPDNIQRDAYIIALATKVNIQTLWIRSAATVLKEIQCGLGEAMAVNQMVAEAIKTVPPVPVEVTVGTTSCLDKSKPFPTMAPLP